MRQLIIAILLFACWASTPKAQVLDAEAPDAPVPDTQKARAIYLDTYIGTGTEGDPFRTTTLGSGSKCIDMRDDPTQAAGYALCGRDTLPVSPGVVELAASTDATLSKQQKQAIESGVLKGDTLASNDLPSILAEVLIDKGVAGQKLRASKDGKYHIWLGPTEAFVTTSWLYDQWHIHDNGLVADASNAILRLIEPPKAWAASISENWNCANNTSLTCQLTWTELAGTDWAISSNQVVQTLTTSGRVRAESPLDTDDFSVSVTVQAFAQTGTGAGRCGCMGRKDSGGIVSWYFFGPSGNGSADEHEVAKIVTGSLTTLDTSAQAQTDGETIELDMDGSSISGKRNGSLLLGPITDTSISGNNYGGIYSFGTTSTLNCTLDNWSAADIVAASPSTFGVLKRRAS